jgi:asparagine synthase (glutamine-hydrolysing)
VCGIAGIATRDGLRTSDPALVDRMLGTLAHRGPDDQYARGDTHAWLGARRLSIIDLDTGRQPLTNETGEIVVSQNGEIYNYVELRDDLVRRGHQFRTKGDTEIIAHLYEEYGERFVDHLRGMFAIALWDGRARRLVLARDRLGKKPLYWRLSEGRLSYGSELKALLEDETVERVVDRRSLALFLQYQYVPAPRTILSGIAKLPPASLLVWDGDEPVISRYWNPEYAPKSSRSFEEDAEAALDLLRESVRLRLRSDVPVGVFLSGGMDSSVVTALAAELSEQPVRTYSIGFEENRYNELPYARAVARHFGTSHTEAVVRLDVMDLLPELAEHYDEPFGDSSAVPTFRVAQLAAADVKVALTGDGGDESFAGYLRYAAQLTLGRISMLPAPLVRTLAGTARMAIAPFGDRSLRRKLRWVARTAVRDRDRRYLALMSIFDDARRAELLRDPAESETSDYLLDVLGSGPSSDLDRILRGDLLTYLPEDLLVKMDRATMAHSLEARAPLLDHRLVEFAAALPEDRKLAHGTSKVLLRAVARRLMPKELVERPKMGFGAPVGAWFDGPLGDRFEELVLAPDGALRDHLDPAVAARLLREHRKGSSTHEHRLWLLLMFELWARRWLSPAGRVA